MEYVATFHTHFGALSFHRAALRQGVEAQMMPVPRRLSASCGTCVRYRGELDLTGLEEDPEGIFQVCGEEYRQTYWGD